MFTRNPTTVQFFEAAGLANSSKAKELILMERLGKAKVESILGVGITTDAYKDLLHRYKAAGGEMDSKELESFVKKHADTELEAGV